MNQFVLRDYSAGEVQAALKRRSPDELSRVVIGVAFYCEDYEQALDLCVELSSDEHPHIRGNAILGLGHLARRFGVLPEEIVKPVVEAGLSDEEEYVRGQAWSAADDINHFLGWGIWGFEAG